MTVDTEQQSVEMSTETEGPGGFDVREDVPRPTLTIIHHPDWDLVGVRAVIPARGGLLGRSSRSMLPGAFDVGKVSREHARVSIANAKVVVEDLKSRNGTLVNGARLERAELEPGDVVGIGGVLLMLTLDPRHFAEPHHRTILGHSWSVAQLLEDVDRVATNPHAVTLVGETGTGKELVAAAIHERSERTGDFVAVNCGALSEGLLESELFGHVQGAFTGATSSRRGLVARAEKGTLFLDEVTSTPPRLQTVMLRLLESGTYRPVGGNDESRADVRVIAAAQPDIHEAIDAGSFRRDLWYRLSRRIVELPPLRERREDIPLLARHFARTERPKAELAPELSLALVEAPWKGNVRELRNVVERSVEASRDTRLSNTTAVPHGRQTPRERPRMRLRQPKRERPSREALVKLLIDVDGRIAVAATQLGVDRKTIYRWLDAHGIDRDAIRQTDPS